MKMSRLPAYVLLLFCLVSFSNPPVRAEEPLDIGSMLPQSKADEQQPPSPPAEPAAAEKPKQKQAPKAKSLPLAGIKDFERFRGAFVQLSKRDQFKYVVYPFILQTRVEGSGDEKAQTLRQNYTAEITLRTRLVGWKNLLVANGYGDYLMTLDNGPERVLACSQRKGDACRYTLEFVWRNNCWRLRSIQTDESGI